MLQLQSFNLLLFLYGYSVCSVVIVFNCYVISVESKGKWDQLNVCGGFILAVVKVIVTCLRMFAE